MDEKIERTKILRTESCGLLAVAMALKALAFRSLASSLPLSAPTALFDV